MIYLLVCMYCFLFVDITLNVIDLCLMLKKKETNKEVKTDENKK